MSHIINSNNRLNAACGMETNVNQDERPGGVKGGQKVHLAASGALWTSAAALVQTAFQFAAVIFFARILDPRDFGIVSVVLVITALVQTVSITGVGPAIVQKTALSPLHVQGAFGIALGVAVVLGGATFLLSAPIAAAFRIDEVEEALRLISVVFFFQGVGVVSEHLIVREMHFKRLACAELFSYVVGYIGVAAWFALHGYGYKSLIFGYISQSALKSIAVFMLRPHSLRLGLNREILTELGYLGTGFSIARLLNFAANNVDNVVVARVLGAEALGSYSRAYQLMAVPARIYGQVIDRVMFPIMSRANEKVSSLARAHLASVLVSATFGLPISVLLVVCASDIVPTLFGARWASLVIPFQLLAFAVYFRVGQKIGATVLRATGAVYISAWVQGAYATSVVVGSLVGAIFGVRGVAAGVVFAVLLHYSVSNMVSMRYSKVTWRDLLSAHRLGMVHALLILFVSLAIRYFLPAHTEAWLRLLLTVLMAGICCATAARAMPEIFLDESFEWLIRKAFGGKGRKRMTA